MKKRNLNSLRLKKERISSFNNTQIVGGVKSINCVTYTLESICKSHVCPTGTNCPFSILLCNTDVVYCGFGE